MILFLTIQLPVHGDYLRSGLTRINVMLMNATYSKNILVNMFMQILLDVRCTKKKRKCSPNNYLIVTGVSEVSLEMQCGTKCVRFRMLCTVNRAQCCLCLVSDCTRYSGVVCIRKFCGTRLPVDCRPLIRCRRCGRPVDRYQGNTAHSIHHSAEYSSSKCGALLICTCRRRN